MHAVELCEMQCFALFVAASFCQEGLDWSSKGCMGGDRGEGMQPSGRGEKQNAFFLLFFYSDIIFCNAANSQRRDSKWVNLDIGSTQLQNVFCHRRSCGRPSSRAAPTHPECRCISLELPAYVIPQLLPALKQHTIESVSV